MVYYCRLNMRANRVASGFTSSNTVGTSQGQPKHNPFLRAGLTLNHTAGSSGAVAADEQNEHVINP